MAHHVSTIRTHLQPGTGRITLHLGSALLVGTCAASTTAVSLARRAFSRTRHPHTRRATERSGLALGERTHDLTQQIAAPRVNWPAPVDSGPVGRIGEARRSCDVLDGRWCPGPGEHQFTGQVEPHGD